MSQKFMLQKNETSLKSPPKIGFTLIELLIVIAIIGILASAVIFGVKRASQNSRDARRQKDLTTIRTTLESFYGVTGSYNMR